MRCFKPLDRLLLLYRKSVVRTNLLTQETNTNTPLIIERINGALLWRNHFAVQRKICVSQQHRQEVSINVFVYEEAFNRLYPTFNFYFCTSFMHEKLLCVYIFAFNVICTLHVPTRFDFEIIIKLSWMMIIIHISIYSFFLIPITK